ncbi:MAG TPA: pyridoxamine 5'-phosphate oxidase [Terricaulis sp.]|nr:pyridoxamine 5'-phosphate oxidase [Terricaulis sp.]
MPGDDLIPPSPKYEPGGDPPPDDAALFAESEPFALFEAWFKEAKAKEPNDPNAMALATADAEGAPDVRMVLLKGVDTGFVFYTNAESAKGLQLEAHPRAAIVMHWKSLRRQVRVRGLIEPVTDAESDAYFQSRDRGARIGAWASQQSRPLEDRLALEKRIAEFAAKFGLGEVPRPEYWRGYRLLPLSIEFWRDRPFRLHDRLVFTREAPGGAWRKTRLYP